MCSSISILSFFIPGREKEKERNRLRISRGGNGKRQWYKMKDEGKDTEERRTCHRRGPNRNEPGQNRDKSSPRKSQFPRVWLFLYSLWTGRVIIARSPRWPRELGGARQYKACIQMLFWHASEQIMARCLNPSQGLHVEKKCPAH